MPLPPFPLAGFGLGLRAPHYETVLAQPQPVDWFEILSENYLEAPAGVWDMLGDIAARYPLVLHGVALNIGGTDPLDLGYLRRLKALAAHLRPACISDHLCWTGVGGVHMHDLLPIPYTREALRHVSGRVAQVQDTLGVQLVLENPASYLEFAASEMAEWEFIAALAGATGCGLLLDINNVHVSAFNHGYDATRYIDALPSGCMAYMHLSGHADHGAHLLDTHAEPVAEGVWELYRHALMRLGFAPTLVEWDGAIPSFEVLLGELDKARAQAQP